MPPTPVNRMGTLDAEFFFAEHDNAPLHMGSVAVFDGPAPEYRDISRLFAAKLPLVPRYRQIVSAAPGQLLRPVWTDDEHFQIRHHVRHATVPAPGGDGQLRAVAAKLLARPLDLTRPLWEEWFLTGLADGRWAIVSKVHHCMADGIGGNDLMTLVFDTDPEAQLPEPVSWVPAAAPSLADRAADQLRDTLTWPLRQLAGAPARLRSLAKPAELAAYGRGLSESTRRLAQPSASFLNGSIGPKRRWAWTTTSLTELKQIRKDHGGTINDVVLAVITGAFRDLLAERHKLTEGLVVRSLVPVSVRGPDEAGVVANRVSAAVREASVPYISIVTRRMYGVASVMAKTDGMSVRYAWPSAESGSLVAQGGVMAAYRREIEASPDPVARRLEIEDRFQRMASVLRQPGLARPLEIIDPRDTRPAIVDYLRKSHAVNATRLGPKLRVGMRP